MLDISDKLDSLIKNENIASFLLVDIEWSDSSGGTVYATDAPAELTFNSNTYSPSAGLGAVSPPNITGDIARDLYSIQLDDATGVYRDRLLSESTGVEVKVKIGFFDTDGSVVSDTLNVFSGKISSWAYTVQNDAPSVNITGTGPLAKLSMVTPRLTTKDSQNKVDTTDTCFDYSYDTQNGATIKWGYA